MRRRKLQISGNLVLQRLDLCGEELDHLAAFSADHVVMVIVIEMVFKIGLVITKSNLASKSRLGQKLECAVNGGMSDRRVLLVNQPMKVINRKMFFSA